MSGSAAVNDSKRKPWDAWEFELPRHGERENHEIWQQVNDKKFHREMHAEIRERAFSVLCESLETKQSAVVLQGGLQEDWCLYDTDCDKDNFRQESYFLYLFMANIPNCYGMLDLEKKEAILFVPYVKDEHQRWTGTREPLSVVSARYGVTVQLTDDFATTLKERNISNVYVLKGKNTDSGRTTTTTADLSLMGVSDQDLKDISVDDTKLHPLLSELRVIKTPKEVEFIRLACLVSSQAHVYVMRHIKAGQSEMHSEALFKAWCNYFGGSRHQAYSCICGSGAHGSILHYGHAGRPNDRVLEDGDTVVYDMGSEYYGYATDLTRSYPVNGKFTDDQAAIYEAVRAAQNAVFESIKPGVVWSDLHKVAERVIIEHLLKIGILHNGTVEEMDEAYIGSVFMPHGLGHFLGLNVHDVGGYPEGGEYPRLKEPGVCYLRTARPLAENMVLTVEPGVYFNNPTLDKALDNPDQAKYINQSVLERFRGTGGVRLEDDVLVTADGYENFSILPTTIEEVEFVIAGKKHSA